MSFLESLLIALFTVTVVFVVLICLYFLLVIFSFVFSAIEKSKSASGNPSRS